MKSISYLSRKISKRTQLLGFELERNLYSVGGSMYMLLICLMQFHTFCHNILVELDYSLDVTSHNTLPPPSNPIPPPTRAFISHITALYLPNSPIHCLACRRQSTNSTAQAEFDSKHRPRKWYTHIWEVRSWLIIQCYNSKSYINFIYNSVREGPPDLFNCYLESQRQGKGRGGEGRELSEGVTKHNECWKVKYFWRPKVITFGISAFHGSSGYPLRPAVIPQSLF